MYACFKPLACQCDKKESTILILIFLSALVLRMQQRISDLHRAIFWGYGRSLIWANLTLASSDEEISPDEAYIQVDLASCRIGQIMARADIKTIKHEEMYCLRLIIL